MENNYNNILKILILFISLAPLHFIAQTSEAKQVLKGLTKISDAERGKEGEQSIALNSNSISIISPEGKLVTGLGAVQYFQSSDYAYDVYRNAKKEVKAIVIRKASAKEKREVKVLQRKLK